jgi:RNA polymerase sigma factor (sigma-70 family)
MALDIGDPNFITLLQKGDNQAWKRFLEESQQTIGAFIWWILRNKTQVWECYWDFIEELFRNKIHQYESTGSFWGWLKKVTICYTINWKEREKKKSDVSLETQNELSVETNTTDHLETKELKELFDQIYEESKHKELILVVRLRELEGLEYEEIAKITGTDVSTLRVYYQRGKNILKDIIKKKYSFLQKEYDLNE